MMCCFLKKRQYNYYCKCCKIFFDDNSNRNRNLPKMVGKFVILDNGYIRCTGCKNEFTKEDSIKFFDSNIITVERKKFE
jgi:hypothetical protein